MSTIEQCHDDDPVPVIQRIRNSKVYLAWCDICGLLALIEHDAEVPLEGITHGEARDPSRQARIMRPG